MPCNFVGSGVVLDWEQQSGRLLASGDVRYIRVWDSTTELKVQVSIEIADSFITNIGSSASYWKHLTVPWRF